MSHAHDVTPDADPALKGIGGWLILMAIGQVLGPIQIISGMVREYGGLPEGTFARFPLAFMGDAAMRLAYVGFLVYVAFLFFNTRAAFPGRFIASYVVGLLLPFAIGIWVTVTSGVNTLGNLASSEFFWSYVPGLVIGALWVAYVLNSERVRNTFVD
jgi:hypothetical protein